MIELFKLYHDDIYVFYIPIKDNGQNKYITLRYHFSKGWEITLRDKNKEYEIVNPENFKRKENWRECIAYIFTDDFLNLYNKL